MADEMVHKKSLPKRKCIRLSDFDYSSNGAYFITACVKNRRNLLWKNVTISTIIGQMKRSVSKQLGFAIWQKSFYDHIIRNEKEYREIWQYIDENPMKWEEDTLNSDILSEQEKLIYGNP